ncbi:hypothetical protein D5266_08730 [bacterium c-19]|nr:hypothetical protein [bacterium c-19]
MISIKDTVYQTLRKLCENVSDVTISDLSVLPFIRFLEEENKVNEWTDNKEQSTYVRYRIDLWDEADTTSLALAVDRQMTQEIGLVRMQCIDVADPLGIKQKTIRFEGILTKNANDDIEVYHKEKE